MILTTLLALLIAASEEEPITMPSIAMLLSMLGPQIFPIKVVPSSSMIVR